MSELRHPLSLLDPIPFSRVDEEGLSRVVGFAFATGDVGDGLERIMDSMPIAPSSWDPSEFAEDIFLRTVISSCLQVKAEGLGYAAHPTLLYRLLGSPPADPAVVTFRQNVLAELATDAELRASFEKLYVTLTTLRGLLSRSGAGARIDAFHRRLEVLRRIKSAVEVALGFERAQSGLVRLGEWGRGVASSEAYARLLELLDYENSASEVDVRLQLGFDGRVREFTVLARRPKTGNPFYQSPASRWLGKIWLLARGEKFSDEELVSRLLDTVFDGLQEALVPLFPLVGDLEFYLAGLSFRAGCEKVGLQTCLPDFTVGGGRSIDELFNPLLLAERGAAKPCDVSPLADDALVVVTGPNSGGKTRFLQALALTQILGQAGLFVPAARATLPWATALFVSLVEHARADQAEGRLGMELVRIRRLFERLQEGSLVIVDELCSGTNPAEGEEIFRLVVKLFRELRPAAFITTHFLAFAARLQADHGDVDFLQVELDASLKPTYQFVPGVATTSLADRTAARLGVTEDGLRTAALANRAKVVRSDRAAPPTATSGRVSTAKNGLLSP